MEQGQTLYQAVFTNSAFAAQSKTVTDIPALGHDWGEAVYTWSADNRTVTATHICLRNASHEESEVVAVTTSVAKEATCTEQGQTLYRAVFANSAFAAQSKTLTDIPALGHDWSEPTYTWSSDHKTVTAKRVCLHDGKHQETEAVSADYVIAKSPTSSAAGQRTWTSGRFTNQAFAVQQTTVSDIPALNSLNGLKLPAAARTIEEEAFVGGAFQYVIIPDGCVTIGSKAFADCPNLIYVYIPASVTSIADDAFAGNTQVMIDQK